MENFIKYQKYISSLDNVNSAYQACDMQLLKKPGIYVLSRMNNTLSIGFNIYEISKAELTLIMDELGLKPYPPIVKKGVVANWIDKLVKTNKESFSGKRLDCCDLNN